MIYTEQSNIDFTKLLFFSCGQLLSFEAVKTHIFSGREVYVVGTLGGVVVKYKKMSRLLFLII